MSMMFRAMYRLGFKPWDTGVSPPELKELVEGPQARRPGRALDLGCGTGTNAVYMAARGWETTGVDFVPRAIDMARSRARAANVTARFVVGDVTRLGDLEIEDGCTLVLDMGCLHSIPEPRRDAYVAGVTAATAPGADFLVWGFYKPPSFLVNAHLTEEEMERRFSAGWRLVRAWGGERPDRLAGRWYHLKRKESR